MDLGVMVNIYEETEFTGAFEDAVEAGYKRGQVNVFLPRITPEEVRLLALAARQAKFHVDAIGCYFNPLRPDDASLHHVDYQDWKTVAANMSMMNGVERIVCWSGTLGKTLTTPNLMNQEEETFNAVVTALKTMIEDTKGLRVEILLEPFTAHVLCDGKSCARLAQKFPAGDVKIVMDAPNVISHKEFGHRDQRVNEFVTEIAPSVGLVHLKDMARDDNGHRRFPRAGAGVLDYASYLRAIAERAPEVPVIIDHVYSVREMIAARQYVEAVAKDSGI
jgi:sugar phosphate isomerase/epimerase